ncbi:hypothetical protein CK203_037998 [Vitis vinifera]|uniref:Uncharacterized protein n=1 Tax=Vitis vinifera TaxID=29760 RepID=A0A438HNV0_VITVI|nr:hypothetical protein CK203_037998 [Vitis vinifera]
MAEAGAVGSLSGKHGIAQDTPSFPSDDEDEALSGPARGRGDTSRAGPSSEQA